MRMTKKTTLIAALILVLGQSALFPVAKAVDNSDSAPNGFSNVVTPIMAAAVNISTVSEVPRNRLQWDGQSPPPGSSIEEMFRQFLEEGPMAKSRKTSSLGSGFIISQEGKDVYVVTCNHVIADADKITVTLNDNSEYEATIVGKPDRRTDLALLKISTEKKVTCLVWGDSTQSHVGDWVIAIGNPFGLSSSVTKGIISSVMRDLPLRGQDSSSIDYIEGYIQTDAPINMGNSGGAMVNLEGKVIGVNTAILSPNGGNIGIGFAIPSSTAKGVIEQLRKFGQTKRGWLGVAIQPVDKELANGLGLSKATGALVGKIYDSSPALKAGVKEGDVILSFNNHDVKDSRQLPRLVGEAPIGSKLPLVVWRNNVEVKLDIVVGEFEEAENAGVFGNNSSDKKNNRRHDKTILGMVVQEIKESQFERLGVTEATKGLVITFIAPDSEASERNLRSGDVIAEVKLEAQAERFKDPKEFAKFVEMARKNKKKNIVLLILRGKERRYVALTLEEDLKDKDASK